MKIILEDIGKKYGFEWIFKSVNLSFERGKSYAITGHNGSGKSTLLQTILGTVLPSKGKIVLPFSKSEIHHYMSFVSPYQQLPLDLSLLELLRMHIPCKAFMDGLTIDRFIELVQLDKMKHKQLQFYSSGMLQRVKLGLAIYAQAPILLLDEPTISLDQKNCDWYLAAIKEVKQDKLLIISSNDKNEYDFCDQVIDVTQYKVVKKTKA